MSTTTELKRTLMRQVDGLDGVVLLSKAAHEVDVFVTLRPGSSFENVKNAIYSVLRHVGILVLLLDIASGQRRWAAGRAPRGTTEEWVSWVAVAVTRGTPRKPRDECTREGKAERGKGIAEVALRPRCRSRGLALALGPRGGNAAYARSR
jgi:hypothetical protein